MSEAKRASDPLRNKTNIHPVNNRKHEATAEDFGELGDIIQDHAERIDLFQNSNYRADFYGYFESLALLESEFPEAEPNAFAIITDSNGRPKKIAQWNDTTAEWEVTDISEIIHREDKRAHFPNVGDEDVFYYAENSKKLYIWYDLDYHDISGSSSKDIIPGTYIDSTNFEDEWNNPVTLKTGKLYVDGGDWYYYNGTELKNFLVDYVSELTEEDITNETPNFGLISGQLLALVANGKNIELRVDGGAVQWRVEGDTQWNDLFLLSEIAPEFRGKDGVLQYKPTPESQWEDLIDINEFIVIPTIGSSGNWYIDGTDTGVPAQAKPTVKYDDDIIGIRDGNNKIFTVKDEYVDGTLSVYLDGSRLTKGNNKDYTEHHPGAGDNGAQINRIISPKNMLIFEYIKK